MPLTPELVLQAYGAGIFPMAEHHDDARIHWIDPEHRGVIPLERFHISRSLRKALLKNPYQLRFDTDFAAVLSACAAREETWINGTIRSIYLELNQGGHAHSQEVWHRRELVGGVYGVVLGGAFFGESMFSRADDASKIALAWLVDRLRLCGFRLFDTQFLTRHLQSLGGVQISRAQYLDRLASATSAAADITKLPVKQTAYGVIQRNTQTS
ncbi:MAG: leucyl/phenylalanyl-tRNA--protein transferase [Paracoccaceae bacterium]